MKHTNQHADSVLLAGRVAGPGWAEDAPRGASESSANAVAIRQGGIAGIGTAREIRAWIGPNTEVVEVPGGLILPGFRDAHIHPILGGMNLVECNLTGLTDLEACLAQIAGYARANQDQDFIRGGGWLPDIAPRREHLDAVVPDRPALLKSIDGHNAWVNTRALELAGITRDTPNPPGGIIERDGDGEATGILREWTAMDLVESRLPTPTLRDRVMAGWAFLQRAAAVGIVSVHEAMAHEEELLAYQALERDGDLCMRVQAALLCEPDKGLEQIDHLIQLRESFQSALITPRTAKIFVDGVIEGRTALLLEPYADMPGYRGECLWPVDELRRLVTALDAHGFQIHFHAVGDQGVRLVLDILEQAQSRNGRPNARPATRRDARHMIAHADLIHPRDIPRFQALGVIANLQPIWFCEEKHFARTTLVSLGEHRAWSLYPVMDLLDSGAALTCGTDWPFSGELNTFNPLESIQIGVTRQGLDPQTAQSYNPAQCVSPAAMLHAHTLGGAYADFQEAVTGSISIGKSADLVILDRDILELPANEISRARVILTMFQGKVIHRASSARYSG